MKREAEEEKQIQQVEEERQKKLSEMNLATKPLLEKKVKAALDAEEARLREAAADEAIVRLIEEKRRAVKDRDAALRRQQESAEDLLK